MLELEKKFLDATPDIERWLRGKWQEHTPPFYGSVDLRNAGFKLAPVDMNLFPGGFNNLNAAFLPLCVQAAMTAIDKICPMAKSLLLIPENHTRNRFYLQNVAQLVTILRMTGLNVRVGSLLPEIDKPTPVELPDGNTLLLEPLVRTRYRIGLADFDPCAVLLNNDLTAGVPEILQNLNEQFILPPLHAGWATRRKSNHFAAYDEVASEFGHLVGIDPWQINPYFSVCDDIDFHERQGEDRLAASVNGVLTMIREKYKEYGIDDTPYVVVKADAGTYGMGVMTVKDAAEVVGLNRRQAQQDVGDQGRRERLASDHPGRRAYARAGFRWRGRAGGVHDRSLRGWRLLPRSCRAWQRRKPQCAGGCTSSHWPSKPVARCPIAARHRMRRQTASTLMGSWHGWRCWPPRWNSNVRNPRRIDPCELPSSLIRSTR